MEDLVTYILAAGESTFFIGGIVDNMSSQVKRMLCLAAVASRVPDAVLEVVMEDDRIPKRLDEIDNEISLEMKYIMALPDFVWMELGAICDVYELAFAVCFSCMGIHRVH